MYIFLIVAKVSPVNPCFTPQTSHHMVVLINSKDAAYAHRRILIEVQKIGYEQVEIQQQQFIATRSLPVWNEQYVMNIEIARQYGYAIVIFYPVVELDKAQPAFKGESHLDKNEGSNLLLPKKSYIDFVDAVL